MYGSSLHTRLSGLVQVFVAQHKAHRPVGPDHQQSLFKPSVVAHQIFKVSAVLHITVDHQPLQTLRTHPGKDLLPTLFQRLVGQRNRDKRTVLPRLRHRFQLYHIIFHSYFSFFLVFISKTGSFQI